MYSPHTWDVSSIHLLNSSRKMFRLKIPVHEADEIVYASKDEPAEEEGGYER